MYIFSRKDRGWCIIKNEVWKVIDEAPDYEVSNLGRIVSKKYGRRQILKQNKKKSGYCEIGLCCQPNERTWFLVHRLVLSIFNPIVGMENMEVNHKDENKLNNSLDNLEWVTSLENCNYGTRNSKLGVRAIKILCIETGVVYESMIMASKLTGTCYSGISNYLHGRQNKAGGYNWEVIS